MDSKDIALPLLASLWALFTIAFNAMKESNLIRDRVLFADKDDFRPPLKQRTLLLYNDWLPFQLILCFTSVAFAAMTAILGFYVTSRGAMLLSFCVSFCALAMVTAVVVTGVKEWRTMHESLRGDSV
jgi:hypothetical protein